MSTITFRPARRENVPLLIGMAGGTGSGKTYSALLLARGMTGGEPFAFIDTENGRAKHYADLFPEMRHADITAPFRPQKYADAIAAGAAEYPVVVVDSMSHEWAGDGGCLDWHDELQGGDPKKNLSAWIEPKREHKRMLTRLLQVGAHVILCFRAEPKVEARRVNGQVQIVPKETLTGLDGWIPISEKMLPYELTASFLLMADAPGVPRPIKLQEQHRALVPLDAPLDESVGEALAKWAAGGKSGAPSSPRADGSAPASAPQSDDASALNALVGSMREARDITTRNLYTAVAQMRGMKPDARTSKSATDLLIALLEGEDDAGELHWSPLRDSLTPEETAALRKRLGDKWKAAQAA